MTTLPPNFAVLAAFTTLTTLGGAHLALAAEPEPRLSIGAATKSSSEVATAPGQSSLTLVIEGAGRIATPAGRLRVAAQCVIVDKLVNKQVVSGGGDCELRSTRGEIGYAHFASDAGSADRGRLSFAGGQGPFAGLGSVAVEISVNPYKVGKPVFLIENVDSAEISN